MAIAPSGGVDVFDQPAPFGYGQYENTSADPTGYTRGFLPIALAQTNLLNGENAFRFSGTAFQANGNCLFYKPPNARTLIVSGYYWSENVAPTGNVTLGSFVRYQNTANKMTTATSTQIIPTPADFVGPLLNNNEWTYIAFTFDLTSVPEGRLIAMDVRRNGAGALDTNNDFSVFSGLFIGFK